MVAETSVGFYSEAGFNIEVVVFSSSATRDLLGSVA
jgi:hypothetical protein